ncbi:MAG: OprO/OprP family phosphate-selective porin [Vicinamibacterales bacterium]
MRTILLTALALAAATVVASAQEPPPAAEPARRGLVWDDRPTVVLGEDVTIGIRGRLQLDWRRFDPEIGEETYDFRTARIGVQGDLTRHFSYEVEREISRDGEFTDWKDVYLAWKTFDAFRIKAGRFKMPFGLEQNTGPTETDFAYRSLASSAIAPGRDRGAMIYGEAGRITYEAGIFDDDGDNAELEAERFAEPGQDLEGVGPAFAARVTGDLLRLLPVPPLVRGANFGVAYTNAYVPEGLNSLKGEAVWGADFFERVYVKGRRQRLGAQFDWTPGPTGLKAEWMQSREQRLGQSNRNEDLSDFVTTGWYVSGTWFITGEDKDNNINPRRPLFQGGIGAVEIGARFDELEITSAGDEGTPFTNPRADHQVPNADRTWTFGVSWMPVRWVRVVSNAIHETFDDVSRAPLTGTESFWSGLVRLQVVF